MRECIFKCCKGLHVNYVLSSYITKFEKGADCLNHLWRNIAFNCRQPDLDKQSLVGINDRKILHTFISALELSLVHCLNPQPSGNRRKPAKGATSAILLCFMRINKKWLYERCTADQSDPVLYLIQYCICTSLAMCSDQVLLHPCNKVVLEHPFDDLMEEVWCYKLMDICMWEVISEWLKKSIISILLRQDNNKRETSNEK